MTELNENNRIGVIYKIEGYGDVYFGSTIQPICERKSNHKTQHKAFVKRGRTGCKCASSIILDKGDDWVLTPLTHILTDDTKKSLLELENKYIAENECVNKNQAIQSVEDLKEYKRKWAEDNRRANGVEPKAVGFDATAYSREYQKKRRAEMTPEEKEAHLEHRKAIRPIQTEEQKEKARARAKKQRDDKKDI